MLKRKLRSTLDHVIASKKNNSRKLDILFNGNQPEPTNVKEALEYIKSLVDWKIFAYKFPAVVVKDQLYSLLENLSQVDSELNRLRCGGEILIIKLDIKLYGIVDKAQYLDTVQQQVHEDADLDVSTADSFSKLCSQEDLDIEISADQLKHRLDDQTTNKLVRAGFLTPEVTGMFYLSIPNASKYLKAFSTGLTHVKSVVRKSKFKEVLMSELLSRTDKKVKKLGMTYLALHLIGSGAVKLASTTTGPLIRYVDDE